MGLKELVAHFKSKFQDPREANKRELDDNETRDHQLRSLRREWRVKMESVEKEQLKKKLDNFKKKEVSQNLYGLKQKRKPEVRYNILRSR